MLLLIFLSLHVSVAGAYDSIVKLSNTEDSITKISFGSCHKTKYPHEKVWNHLINEQPHIFWWLGDLMYTNRYVRQTQGTLQSVIHGFQNMSKDPFYMAFKNGLNDLNGLQSIEGVWDDHDYGVNDGGKYVTNRTIRQQEFLNFLNVPQNDIQRRNRKGVYSSHRYIQKEKENENNGIIDVIFLDTRTHRDDHYIPSLANTGTVPKGAVIATFTRLFTHLSGVQHTGDILGENQWIWLENQLNISTSISSSKTNAADVTILVSSIQTLTKNPMVESWIHFPLAKKRLLKLINKYRPNNFFILSGDVHYAEIISKKGKSNVGNVGNDGNVGNVGKDGIEVRAIEITSSGLTHSCMDPIWGRLCPYIHWLFGSYRTVPKKNYGTLHINWKKKKLKINIQNALNGQTEDSYEHMFRKGDDEIEMWKDLLEDATLNWSRWSLRIVLICGLLFIGRWLKSCCRRIDDQPPKKRKQN